MLLCSLAHASPQFTLSGVPVCTGTHSQGGGVCVPAVFCPPAGLDLPRLGPLHPPGWAPTCWRAQHTPFGGGSVPLCPPPPAHRGPLTSSSAPQYACMCVCVCVYVSVGCCHFYQVSRISPYGHPGVLGSGHSHRSRPTVRAQGASLWYHSTSVICTLDQNLARCPRTTLEVRVVAPWLPPGRLHGNSSTSPSWPCCPVCCVCDGAITAGGARGSEAASMPTHSATFSEKGALDARLPPPAPRHAHSGNRTHDLSGASPTLSPVELAGDPCVYVSVCVCNWWSLGAILTGCP